MSASFPDDKARPVKLLLLDVDGVLTDGRIYFSNHGDEMKAFSILDGQGLRLIQDNGVQVGIITGRESVLVSRRAAELGINLLFQNCGNKLAVFDRLLAELQLSQAETAFVGDDLPDLGCIRKAGLGIAVANAHATVRKHADFVTETCGGEGAVREVCDLILRAQGRYDSALARYLQGA